MKTGATKEKLIVPDYRQCGGKHCWTTSLKCVFDYHGLHLSEEMVFGLGGGLGFIYWYMKMMPAPFVGGRYGKGMDSFANTCARIGGSSELRTTGSAAKGYEELKKILRGGDPVVVLVDMAYLPYFAMPEDAHFGGHTIVVYGIDEEADLAYIADRGNATLTVTLDELARARNSKFQPFPPKNALVRIDYPAKIADLGPGIEAGIRESCDGMLNPPIKNFGLAGIKKWADTAVKWQSQFKGFNLYFCLFNVFIYIEIGGTGGGFFRPMYAAFLDEASAILDKPELRDVASAFRGCGALWSEIAKAALPDSWPTLKRIRELNLESNRLFEQQPEGALETMHSINNELDELMRTRIDEEFSETDRGAIDGLVGEMRAKILEVQRLEANAFAELSRIIG